MSNPDENSKEMRAIFFNSHAIEELQDRVETYCRCVAIGKNLILTDEDIEELNTITSISFHIFIEMLKEAKLSICPTEFTVGLDSLDPTDDED